MHNQQSTTKAHRHKTQPQTLLQTHNHKHEHNHHDKHTATSTQTKHTAASHNHKTHSHGTQLQHTTTAHNHNTQHSHKDWATTTKKSTVPACVAFCVAGGRRVALLDANWRPWVTPRRELPSTKITIPIRGPTSKIENHKTHDQWQHAPHHGMKAID